MADPNEVVGVLDKDSQLTQEDITSNNISNATGMIQGAANIGLGISQGIQTKDFRAESESDAFKEIDHAEKESKTDYRDAIGDQNFAQEQADFAQSQVWDSIAIDTLQFDLERALKEGMSKKQQKNDIASAIGKNQQAAGQMVNMLKQGGISKKRQPSQGAI